ncbi:DMT family transporter [Peredibacter starrii]|uniref:DMT family transporter n=1 Tax=Peredibacter starrii TaxID=28202 RepID=A0AAX4HSQ8_9BACT|nr:DMT family transporter [Peredibacter starrii]WPU66230.1 DMT family transporter [Peredibacter starrii]
MAGTLLVIIACLFWGLDTLIRYPLVERGIHPITIVFYEHMVLVAIFSLGLIPAIKRIGELKLADVFSFFIIGGIGSAIATVAFTESFQYLNPSLVILLQKLQPIVAIILAAIVLKEEIQKQFIIWAAVCLIGGLLVSSPDIERFYHLMRSNFGAVTSDAAVKGYGLVAISIVGWGATTVFGKRLSMVGFEPKSIMAGRFLSGLLVLIPFVQWNRSLILPSGEDYLRILIMVIISGALAMWFYYQGLKRLSAKTTAIAEMFFPFFAIIFNWIFLGKQLSEVQLVGGGILIFGSLVIQLKKY